MKKILTSFLIALAIVLGVSYTANALLINPGSSSAAAASSTVTINSVTTSTFSIIGSGNVTSTVSGGTTTFLLTGVIPAANGGTATTTTLGTNAFNSTQILGAGLYLAISGTNLTVSSTLASSSITFLFGNATTTAPAYQDAQTPNQKNITAVNCFEAAAATTTIELYYNTTLASSGIQQVILASIACGINGATTTTFTTSTLPANANLFAIVSSTAGVPTLTTVNVIATKQ